MHVPYIKKIKYSGNALIERALPQAGYINAKIGQKIEPFTKLALTKVPTERVELGARFTPVKTKTPPAFFYSGETIGMLGFDKFEAPFSGYLQKEGSAYVFSREPHDYWLLGGVWGDVVNILDTKALLIKTNTTDIAMTSCINMACSGELVVFPNPSNLLSMHYLEKFAKEIFGTIIYVGNTLSNDLLIRAGEMGVVGLLAGSADRSAFVLAKERNMFLGTFMGFGNIPTPNSIYEILKPLSNRYVFVEGDRGVIRIPSPEPFTPEKINSTSNTELLREVVVGLYVAVLEKPFFGYCGLVEKITESSIVVRLEETNELVDVSPNNVLAI